jgi:hypothetical protein
MQRLAFLSLLLSSLSVVVASPPAAIVFEELIESAPLARVLRVALAEPAALDVEYWTADEAPLAISSPPAASHAVTLARLRPGRTYEYRVNGTLLGGVFRTDPLPADLAAVRFAATGAPTTPLALVHLFKSDGFKGYAVVDGRGEVVWYWRTKDFPFGMARLANGNFVFMDKGRGVVVVTPAGETVHELAQDAAEREMHHDLITTPAGTVLYLAFDTEDVEGKRVKGEAIWEWTPATGALHKRWRSWDHLSPLLDRGPRFAGEWMHANSLALGPRGNLLVSSHYLNQILSLTPDWKRIEWRLGGVRATVRVPPEEQFSGQHTAVEIAPGRVVLFDNGRDRGKDSRAVEFALSEGAATKVWEWLPRNRNYASAVSSARRLPNGNTLVAFGMSKGSSDSSGPTEAFEVTPAGETVWHLLVSGTTTMFRVEPLDAIAGELTRP